MQVIFYGKTGCKKCEDLKDKIRLVGAKIDRYVCCDDLETLWLTDPVTATEARSALSFFDDHYPVVELLGCGEGDGIYDYSGATKALKKEMKK